jgi:hypothetical protein
MNALGRFAAVEHLSNAELDDAIEAAQKPDETRLVRLLYFLDSLIKLSFRQMPR